MARTWAHLHLPRLQSGTTPDVISVKVTGERIDYASFVVIADCEFKVSEAGRQRCLREGVRNVHAWVVGVEETRVKGMHVCPHAPAGWRTALYSPFKGSTFVDSVTFEPVLTARRAILSGKHVWYQV